MTLFKRQRLPETDVHRLLSSPRRRVALEHLWRSRGVVTVRDLSEAIATAETGLDPAPRNLRESVYNSLHQTHLPTLHEHGLVLYDSDRKEVMVLDEARTLARYTSLVTPIGITWVEYYRALGIVGLVLVVCSLAGVPLLAAVDALVFASLALALFALTGAYQLWTERWKLRLLLRRPGDDGARRQ